MWKGRRYGNICVGLVFYVIVGRHQNDTISCSWIFQNKFETVYIFRGWCYRTVIPACANICLECCGLSFQTHRYRPKVISLHIFIMLSIIIDVHVDTV